MPEIYSWQGQEIFLFNTEFRQALGLTQPPTRWVPGILPPEANRPGREDDHSLSFNAEVKNDGTIPPFHHMPSWYSD
jgi:hypothetical protein